MKLGAVPTNARSRPRARAATPTRELTLGELAWLVALPVAAVELLAIVVLGPPLGRLVLSGHPVTFWAVLQANQILPEPTEQARFLIALTAPALLAATMFLLAPRSPRLAPALATTLVRLAQAAGLAFVVVCVIVQRGITFGPLFEIGTGPLRQQYFTPITLAAALLIAIALTAGIRVAALRERFVAWMRPSRVRTIAAAIFAVVVVVLWLLHAFNTEGTIGQSDRAVFYHTTFILDETSAVLDGRSPLVNFVAQYGSLWLYLVAGVMALFGTTLGVFSAAMCTISGLAMLGLYDVLRRVSRSPLGGLLLFLPVLATAFFIEHGTASNRYTIATLYGAYPLRFAGVWLLAWLTARHLDGSAPRRLWLLFLAAGLVVLNNTDHGIPAFGATLVALLSTSGRPTRASLTRLALMAGAGLLGAFALVSVLTLVRAGSLPHVALLFRYTRLFAGAGFAMLPMPTIGFQLVIYLTFVAAIGVATVRALQGEPDRLLTGMLAWVGVFGLGAGSYYVGRSHPEVLVTSFSVWAVALALLLVVVLRRLAAAPARWPTIAEAACIFGFAVTVCSLAQAPAPWTQVKRLRASGPPAYHVMTGQHFVAAHTHRGEHVSILIPLGHRLADTLGIVDVTPYTGIESILTFEQLDETLAALRQAGGHKVFLFRPAELTPQEVIEELHRHGFELGAEEPKPEGLQMWADHG